MRTATEGAGAADLATLVRRHSDFGRRRTRCSRSARWSALGHAATVRLNVPCRLLSQPGIHLEQPNLGLTNVKLELQLARRLEPPLSKAKLARYGQGDETLWSAARIGPLIGW